jgi:hypothetical protein
MLHAIGEATMQQTVRANYDSEIYAQKGQIVRKTPPGYILTNEMV